MEEKEPSFTAGRNVNWYSNMENSMDPATPLLGVYPPNLNTLIPEDICTPNAALFMMVKTWKQQKCPSLDDWIKKCGTYIQWNNTQP